MSIENTIRSTEKMIRRMIVPYMIGCWEIENNEEMTEIEEARIEEAVKIIAKSVSRGIEEAISILQKEGPIVMTEAKNINRVMKDAVARINLRNEIEEAKNS
jgi:hypothetical protein